MSSKHFYMIPQKHHRGRLFAALKPLIFLAVILLIIFVVIPIKMETDHIYSIKNKLEENYGVTFHYKYKESGSEKTDIHCKELYDQISLFKHVEEYSDIDLYYFYPEGGEDLLVAGASGEGPSEVVPFSSHEWIVEDFEAVIIGHKIKESELSNVDLNNSNIHSLAEKIYDLQSGIEEEFRHYHISFGFNEDSTDPYSMYYHIFPYTFNIDLKVSYSEKTTNVNFNFHDKNIIEEQLKDLY